MASPDDDDMQLLKLFSVTTSVTSLKCLFPKELTHRSLSSLESSAKRLHSEKLLIKVNSSQFKISPMGSQKLKLKQQEQQVTNANETNDNDKDEMYGLCPLMNHTLKDKPVQCGRAGCLIVSTKMPYSERDGPFVYCSNKCRFLALPEWLQIWEENTVRDD